MSNYRSPDCRDGNHRKCPGLALDPVEDAITTCGCTGCDCFDRNWPADERPTHG